MIVHGFALLMLALLGTAPAMWQLNESIMVARQTETAVSVPAWVYLLLFWTLVLIAYSVYIMQLPHRVALRVASAVLLLTSATYATLLGLTLLAGPQHDMLTLLQLRVSSLPANAQRARPEAIWCLTMVALTSLMAIWFGLAGSKTDPAELPTTAR